MGSQRMGGRQYPLKNLRTPSLYKDLSNETKCWDVYKVGLAERVKEKEWHCATKPLKRPSSQVRISSNCYHLIVLRTKTLNV
jgi:hypothetical protein